MTAAPGSTRRPGRLWRRFERVVLGILMGVGVRVVERRLQRMLRKSGAGSGRQAGVRIR